MRAGQNSLNMSVSPNSGNDDNSRDLGNVDKNGKAREEEDMTEEMKQEIVGRVVLDGEDEVVRKLIDPKLPSREEVDKHHISGHLPYRNWCPICIQAKGKDMDHKASV